MNRTAVVLNDAYGLPEDLPFDISKRVLVRYRLDDPAAAAGARQNLSTRLQSAISAMAFDDHLRPLRESGLSDTDIKLFTAIYAKMLEEDGDICGYDVLLKVGADLGLDEQGVDDATQMISDRGFWRASPVSSQHRFSLVRANASGMEQYCKAFLPGYSKLPDEVGRLIVAGTTSSGEIANATGQPETVIEHLLNLLENNDYIRVTRSNVGTHVFEVRAKLRRAFSDPERVVRDAGEAEP